MSEGSLVVPGSAEVPGYDDVALLSAMLEVELAWVTVQASHGLIDAEQRQAVVAACAEASWQPQLLTAGAADGGNPVIPLVQHLRARAAEYLPVSANPDYIHRGLTSQDVLDSALMLLSKRLGGQIQADLDTVSVALAQLAVTHRETPMLARTLSKGAGRTSFGSKVASWHQLVAEASAQLARTLPELPLAYGGAAGNLAVVLELVGGRQPAVFELLEDLAAELGLAMTPVPWHVGRYPVQRLAAALAEASSSVGKIANDVVLLNREESAELAEPVAPGRGGSSSMAHKQNPVLSIRIRRAALAAPHLLGQVFTGAALANDERPDAGWHLEWEPLLQLLRDAAIAGQAAVELTAGLAVDASRMARILCDFELASGVLTPPGVEPLLIERSLARYGKGSYGQGNYGQGKATPK